MLIKLVSCNIFKELLHDLPHGILTSGLSPTVMDTHGLEEIKQRLEQSKVVAVTCLGITSPLLSNKRFDVCIMDEAGQTTLPVCS